MSMQHQNILLHLLTREGNKNHHCIESDLVKQVKNHILSLWKTKRFRGSKLFGRNVVPAIIDVMTSIHLYACVARYVE